MQTAPAPTAPPSGIGLRAVFLAVFFPSLALLLELVTHAWASEFTDPIPTPLHVALIACVPLSALFASVVLDRGAERLARAALHSNAFALAVAGYYAVAMSGQLVPALILLVFLIGVLPLSPALAGAGLLQVRLRLCRRFPEQARAPGRSLALAGAALIALFLALHAPRNRVLALAREALGADPRAASDAVARLRAMDAGDALLDLMERPEPLISDVAAHVRELLRAADDGGSGRDALATVYFQITGGSAAAELALRPPARSRRAGGLFEGDDD